MERLTTRVLASVLALARALFVVMGFLMLENNAMTATLLMVMAATAIAMMNSVVMVLKMLMDLITSQTIVMMNSAMTGTQQMAMVATAIARMSSVVMVLFSLVSSVSLRVLVVVMRTAELVAAVVMGVAAVVRSCRFRVVLMAASMI
jgi:hypothetical protein